MQTTTPAAQITDLTRTLADLRSQAVIIDRQLRNRGLDAPVRAELAAQRAQLQAQIAQTNAELKAVSSQTGAPQGTIVVPPAPPTNTPPSTGPQWDPDMIIALGGAVIVFIFFPLAVGFARRMWRGVPAPAIPHVINEIPSRLDRLEQAVDAIAIEVERISEGQRFMTKMMAERSAPSESKPMLGAGPAEPMRVGQREAMKEEKSGI
jgi:hypothetical protein